MVLNTKEELLIIIFLILMLGETKNSLIEYFNHLSLSTETLLCSSRKSPCLLKAAFSLSICQRGSKHLICFFIGHNKTGRVI